MNTDVGRSIDTGHIAELLNTRAPADRSALIADLVQEVLRCMARLEADQADLSRAVETLRVALAEEGTDGQDPLSRVGAQAAPVEEEPWAKVLGQPGPDHGAVSYVGPDGSNLAATSASSGLQWPSIVPPGTVVLSADAADEVLSDEFALGEFAPAPNTARPTPPVAMVPTTRVGATSGGPLAPPARPDAVDALLAAEFGPVTATPGADNLMVTQVQSRASIDDLLSSALTSAPPPAASQWNAVAPPGASVVPQSDEAIDSVLSSLSPATIDRDVLGPPEVETEPTGVVGAVSSEEDDNLASFLGREFLAQNSESSESDVTTASSDADGQSTPLWRSGSGQGAGEEEQAGLETGNPFFASEMPRDDFFARSPRLRRRHH